MAQQKRYKLLIWFYLHNHLHKSIHAAHSMEVELTREAKEAFEVAGIPFPADR